MSGTVETLRIAGMSDSGFPSEIDSTLKVRFVAPLLVNMSERSTDLLKYIGGPETFVYNRDKIEWVKDDPWNRRLSHSGLAAGTTTTLTVTGAAHRYPVGTILYNRNDDEYTRVTGHVDANNLTIKRDIVAGVTEGSWASTDEVYVAGFAMHENDNWVFRPTAVFSMPYNYSQVQTAAVQASFRRMETAIYGLQGSDLDKVAADTVAEQFVALEMAAVQGYRYAGASAVPAMLGGMKFFHSATIGDSTLTDVASAALTRKDIDDTLQTLYYAVGGEKMAKTLVVSAWAKRKISGFFSSAERLGPGTGQTAGIVVDRLNTDFGVVDILLHTAVAQNEILVIRRENHRMGHHGTLGRPQLRQLPPSTTGPRVQQAFYADVSMINSGLLGEARIHTFSLTS